MVEGGQAERWCTAHDMAPICIVDATITAVNGYQINSGVCPPAHSRQPSFDRYATIGKAIKPHTRNFRNSKSEVPPRIVKLLVRIQYFRGGGVAHALPIVSYVGYIRVMSGTNSQVVAVVAVVHTHTRRPRLSKFRLVYFHQFSWSSCILNSRAGSLQNVDRSRENNPRWSGALSFCIEGFSSSSVRCTGIRDA